MSNFFNYNEDSANEADKGGFTPLKTGIYDAIIETASLVTAGTGTKGIDYAFTINGNKEMVYGSWIQKADGTTLIDGNKLNALMGLLGIKDLSTVPKTITKHDGSTMKVDAIKELDGKAIKVAIQVEKDYYNGKEKDKLKVHTFFNKDGFTFGEVSSKSTETKKLNYLTDNLKDTQSKNYKEWKADAPEQETEAEDENPSGSLLG